MISQTTPVKNGAVFLDFIKNWNRTILIIITMIVSTTVAVVTLKTAVESNSKELHRRGPIIESHSIFINQQVVKNETFEKTLDNIDDKLDNIISRLPNR